MRKKNYRGVKCVKRSLKKCEGVCKTYDVIQYAFADALNLSEDVESFKVNVFLDGLQEGEYTSDFVIKTKKGNLMIRECLEKKHLTKPLTTKLLDLSRNYWLSHGISNWGLVIGKESVEDD